MEHSLIIKKELSRDSDKGLIQKIKSLFLSKSSECQIKFQKSRPLLFSDIQDSYKPVVEKRRLEQAPFTPVQGLESCMSSGGAS